MCVCLSLIISILSACTDLEWQLFKIGAVESSMTEAPKRRPAQISRGVRDRHTDDGDEGDDLMD